jgi:hypothetical protein
MTDAPTSTDHGLHTLFVKRVFPNIVKLGPMYRLFLIVPPFDLLMPDLLPE